MIFESNLECLAFAKISGVYLKVNLIVTALFPPPLMAVFLGARVCEMLWNQHCQSCHLDHLDGGSCPVT